MAPSGPEIEGWNLATGVFGLVRKLIISSRIRTFIHPRINSANEYDHLIFMIVTYVNIGDPNAPKFNVKIVSKRTGQSFECKVPSGMFRSYFVVHLTLLD